jgi:hypothetical protein
MACQDAVLKTLAYHYQRAAFNQSIQTPCAMRVRPMLRTDAVAVSVPFLWRVLLLYRPA